MPRKVTKSLQRKVSPDRKYQSVLVQRLINKSILDGKKQAAERAVYSALEGAAKKLGSEDPVAVFEKAIANVSPDFEVKSRRVGGANYQIPFPISGHRQQHFAFSWLVQSARARQGMPYALSSKSSTLTTRPVPPSKRKRTATAWLRPTAPSPISRVHSCWPGFTFRHSVSGCLILLSQQHEELTLPATSTVIFTFNTLYPSSVVDS